MQQNAKTFLGNGLNFPLRIDARGQVVLVTGSEDINQAIRIILGTTPGERVMRPNFGCQVNNLLFEPIIASTIGLVQDYVLDALRMWEPRIEVLDVKVTTEVGHPGVLLTEIGYRIKATHDTRSIVYPFYIADEQEIG
jgi:uncharacterized protein